MGGLFGGAKAPAPVKPKNPEDEKATGVAEARQQRRALRARSGRSGLRNLGVDEGLGRTGISIN